MGVGQLEIAWLHRTFADSATDVNSSMRSCNSHSWLTKLSRSLNLSQSNDHMIMVHDIIDVSANGQPEEYRCVVTC